MKKLFSIVLALAMVLSLAACGGTDSSSSSSGSSSQSGSDSSTESSESSSDESSSVAGAGRWDALQTTDEQVNLLVTLHNFMPTINPEPTEEAPIVKKIAQTLTDQWLEDKPNVNFEWARNITMDSEWLTVTYTAGTGPDVLFWWGGSELVQDGWAMTLDDVIQSPNYYEPNSPIWYDMYPEYLFVKGGGCRNDYDQIISIPASLNPGPATAFFYNESIFNELGLEPQTDWDAFVEMCATIREAGYVPIAPWGETPRTCTLTSWVASQFLTPLYSQSASLDVADYDGDGVLSANERFRGIWEGKFYLENNPALVDLYQHVFYWYTDVLSEGWETVDYTQAWQNGEVAMKEDGMWSLPTIASDTKREFDFDLFPWPGTVDSEYATQVEYTAGPYNPTLSVSFNIMEPSLQNRPEYQADYVVDYLKYMLTTENLSMMVEELQGEVLGAVKGCAVPSVLGDWFTKQFPQMPTAMMPGRPNNMDSSDVEYKALQEMAVKGMVTFDEFCKQHDELMYKDIQMFVEEEQNKADSELDMTDWGELVAPSWMA